MDIMAQVGPQTASDGSKILPRLGKTGEVVTQQLGADYYELTKRGKVFMGQTAVGGVAPGTALGTTAAFALYNPAGSGIDLVVLKTTVAYLSGTLGAGNLVYAFNVNPVAAAVTGTAIVAYSGYLTNANGAGKPLTTATLPTTPVLAYPFASLTALLASTAVSLYQIVDEPRGSIIVPPGCCVSVQGIAAAGTSPLVLIGMVWAEVAV